MHKYKPEDTTRLKRVKKVIFNEISGVDQGGCQGAEIKLMRDNETLWQKFTRTMGFKRLHEGTPPVTVKEIMDADAKRIKANELEMAFNESMWRILNGYTGSEQIALLKKTVAEFAAESEEMAELQRIAFDIGSMLHDVEVADLPPMVVEKIQRALKPQENPETEEAEMPKKAEDILGAMTDEDREALTRHFAPAAAPAPEVPVEPLAVTPAAVAPVTPAAVAPAPVEVSAPVVVPEAPTNTEVMDALTSLTRSVAALAEKTETDELTVIARKYKGVGRTHAELVSDLREAKEAGEGPYKTMIASLDRSHDAAKLVEKSALFGEIGASGAQQFADPDSVTAKVDKEAAEVFKRGDATSLEIARAELFKQNPDLRRAYQAEDQARIARALGA